MELPDLLFALNNAGQKFNAYLLYQVFKQIETEADKERHNFVMEMMAVRIGEEKENFAMSVADLLEQYSLRNIEHGKKNKS